MPTINALMAALVAELAENEIPTPLAQSFTPANVWADLARLAGEEPPAPVLALVGEALDAICEPLPLRGSYRDHARQFAPAD
ncbi:MAG TPA: hypothetical protein VIL85_21710 [Thermomicrobiales bacterium]|jgi:hypothetical protein